MPEVNEERSKLLFNASSMEVLQPEGESKKRKFKGVAYAGGRVDGHWYWGRSGVVFDLDGIEIDKPTALLEEHFSSGRVGVVKQVSTTGKIEVEGDFLSNTKAKEIVQDSDDGFPFQMSMYIDPGSVEEVSNGKSVVVNGQTFEGPITVFRQNRIREFTICTTGADRNTSINAFSGKQQTKQEDTNVTELEQAKEFILTVSAHCDFFVVNIMEFTNNSVESIDDIYFVDSDSAEKHQELLNGIKTTLGL